MISSFVEQVVNEMKSHPFTLTTVLALILFAAYAQYTHASSDEVIQLSSKVERVLILQIGESIRSLNNQMCEVEGHQKEILLQTIDDLQQDYIKLTGTRYPTAPCTTS